MQGNWWLLWVAFMFFFLVTPVGYGWGYRGWGAPYPRYLQQRRAAALGSLGHHQRAWGRGGDFIWVVMAVGALWLLGALWWHH